MFTTVIDVLRHLAGLTCPPFSFFKCIGWLDLYVRTILYRTSSRLIKLLLLLIQQYRVYVNGQRATYGQEWRLTLLWLQIQEGCCLHFLQCINNYCPDQMLPQWLHTLEMWGGCKCAWVYAEQVGAECRDQRVKADFMFTHADAACLGSRVLKKLLLQIYWHMESYCRVDVYPGWSILISRIQS